LFWFCSTNVAIHWDSFLAKERFSAGGEIAGMISDRANVTAWNIEKQTYGINVGQIAEEVAQRIAKNKYCEFSSLRECKLKSVKIH
jgi:hypothetical protein